MYFEAWSLTKPGAHPFIYTGWPVNIRSLLAPDSPIAMGLCTTPCLNSTFPVVFQTQVLMLV